MTDRKGIHKTGLLGMDEDELRSFFEEIGEPAYRGTQLYTWLYNKRITSFEPITAFSKSLRSYLSEHTAILYPVVIEKQHSQIDGTTKFLLELEDGNKIESVLIPRQKNADDLDSLTETVCVSTQVGCALGCKFCATGAMKFTRNLTAGEILSQILIAEEHATRRITNVVFMGMGEPLLNIGAVVKTIKILVDDRAGNMRARGITVSTAGIPEGIIELAKVPIRFRLAISLHSLNREIRNLLMPINKKYEINQVIESAIEYSKAKRDRITFEYITFDGINDSDRDVNKLVTLSKRIPMKINLIQYHPLDHLSKLGLKVDAEAIGLAPSKRINEFADALRARGITVFIRSNAGQDINGACGQLAAKNLQRTRKKMVIS
ncbi:MAG: 23S rRNA (adenine(2503)-C(2))-methyltransferase RlmN [Candidatus Kryptoniota bacterium]